MDRASAPLSANFRIFGQIPALESLIYKAFRDRKRGVFQPLFFQPVRVPTGTGSRVLLDPVLRALASLERLYQTPRARGERLPDHPPLSHHRVFHYFVPHSLVPPCFDGISIADNSGSVKPFFAKK